MSPFAVKAIQLLLSLSILIVLHELGHFIPAKLFKTRVEKFFLFFEREDHFAGVNFFEPENLFLGRAFDFVCVFLFR